MSKKRFIKNGAMLASGGLLGAACGFARNIIIARLISVEDFGIAATFAMTMSLIEMASNLAIDRLIVQAPDGDDRRLLATAHAFQVVRGIIAGLILFAVSGPIAIAFGVPEVAWAFRLIAAVPVIRAFGHLDVSRFQRFMRYKPLVIMEAVPQLLATAAAAPLALWLNDYRVMLWVVLLQVSVTTLVSHIVAEHPYRWAWDTDFIRRMVRFGWPLLVDGGLIFLAFHGEKVIVGSTFSIEELGWYSAAVTLAMAPSLLATSVLARMLLPGLSARQMDTPAFADRYASSSHTFLLIGTVFAIGLVIGGGAMLVLLFGEKYEPAEVVMPWLAIAFGLRVARAGQALGAIAKGSTHIAMLMNLVRSVSLVIAIVFAALDFGIEAIAVSSVLGEVLAYAASHVFVWRHSRLHMPRFWTLTMASAGLIAISLAMHRWALAESISPVFVVLLACLAGGVSAAVLCGFSQELRSHLSRSKPHYDSVEVQASRGATLGGGSGPTVGQSE